MRPHSKLISMFVVLLLSTGVHADDVVAPEPEDAILPGLTGREIYDRILKNRFDSYIQETTLVSGDRAGGVQESRLRLTWKNYRKEANNNGTQLSKTMIKYSHPFDLRYSGYLIINYEGRPNDQFVYLAESRRVRRVNLRAEAVFGTDFTFEDVVPREFEDGVYRRLPDELVEETPCYVVEVTPNDDSESEYSRFVVIAEKEHFVPLRTRYWDRKGIEIKEMTAPVVTVRDFGGVHVPMELTMKNLQLDTYTTLKITELTPNPELSRRTFDLRRLEGH